MTAAARFRNTGIVSYVESSEVESKELIESTDMNESIRQFRRALIKELAAPDFDVDRIRNRCSVSVGDAKPCVEFVFEKLCLRASSDGEVTDSELQTLHRYGARLGLSEADQMRILTAAKEQVFSIHLKQARDDGIVTAVEEEDLYELRESLGLPPVKKRSRHAKPPVVRQKKRRDGVRERVPDSGRAERLAHERRKMRRDLVVLAGLLLGFLCAGAGWIGTEHSDSPVLFMALGAPGVLLIVGCSAILYYRRYSCPECGKGWLRPIARPEDGTVVEYDSDGNRHTRMISQFYDCDACGYREWIEH